MASLSPSDTVKEELGLPDRDAEMVVEHPKAIKTDGEDGNLLAIGDSCSDYFYVYIATDNEIPGVYEPVFGATPEDWTNRK